MITLKEVLATLDIVKTHYENASHIDITAMERETELRTKLARALARDNGLNPDRDDDINHGVIQLPASTILSSIAEALFKKYCRHIFTKLHLIPGSHITFKTVRTEFQRIRGQKSEVGLERSWRPNELTAFNQLCIRLGEDNAMQTSDVMAELEEGDQLELSVNAESLQLAIKLFQEFKL